MTNSPSCRVEKLASRLKRDLFSCGEDSLDTYFHHYIQQDSKKKICAPYVLMDSDLKSIIGYYTLSTTGIPIHDFPESIIKKLPKYPVLPAILIGRLAIDKNYHGQGYGDFLLMDALYKSLQYSQDIGAFAVIVDAINENASVFYQRYGFSPFPDTPRKLFLPMKRIQASF